LLDTVADWGAVGADGFSSGRHAVPMYRLTVVPSGSRTQ
jgi:hypothetical protein